MPFMPLSPTRLYSSRKSRDISDTTNPSLVTDLNSSEMKHFSETSSKRFSGFDPTIDTSTGITKDGRGQRFSWKELVRRSFVEEQPAFHSNEHDLEMQRNSNNTESVLPASKSTLAPDILNEEAASYESPGPVVMRSQSRLFDNTSESEYSVEDGTRPIVGRASSVRVSKPKIVENKPTRMPNIPSGSSDHSRSNSRSSLKAERVPGHQPETLPSMPEENSQQQGGVRLVTEDDVLARDILPSDPFQTSAVVVPSEPAFAATEHAERDLLPSRLAGEAALPTGSTLHSLRPSIVSPERLVVFDTNNSEGTLNRAMSAPLRLPGKGLNRRVTIRPADLITKDHHDHSSFRESVVTTPYPPRLSSEASNIEAGEDQSKDLAEAKSNKRSKRRKDNHRVSSPDLPGARDRFPSPERPEILVLDLGLHSHQHVQTSVEIQITDRSTFDDEALFRQIRSAYLKHLLMPYRRVLAIFRKARYVTMDMPSSHIHPSLNSPDFLRHVQDPRIGRKRKSWTIWLRNHNTAQFTNQDTTNTPQIRQIDDLQRHSLRSRDQPHSRHSSQSTKSQHTDRDVNNADENKRLSTPSDASSFFFAYSPALPKLPFLSNSNNFQPRNQSPMSTNAQANANSACRFFFWPSIAGSPSVNTSASITGSGHCEAQRGLIIWFHHEFRLGVITLLTMFNVLFAVLCAVIWVVFGVPGTRPGTDDQRSFNHRIASVDWRVHSQARVLTGVVIGLVVLVLGCLFEGLMIWASWVLL